MTVFPLTIDLKLITLTGYGLMVMAGFFFAGWAMQEELRRRRLNEVYAWDVVLAAMVGGIVGAKLWYAGLHGIGTLTSRSGMVWYGGFLGGVLAVVLMGVWRRVPLRFGMDLTAPVLAAGYALGRVGCFMVGDDYGVPTTLPWGIKFPEGVPPTTAADLAAWGVRIPEGVHPSQVLAVHPTQLYEVAAMLLVFSILWRLRAHRHAMGWLFGLYLLLGGAERFLVEFLRAKDDRFLGHFTLAQGTSAVLMVAGAYILMLWWKDDGARLDPIPQALEPPPPPTPD